MSQDRIRLFGGLIDIVVPRPAPPPLSPEWIEVAPGWAMRRSAYEGAILCTPAEYAAMFPAGDPAASVEIGVPEIDKVAERKAYRRAYKAEKERQRRARKAKP